MSDQPPDPTVTTPIAHWGCLGLVALGLIFMLAGFETSGRVFVLATFALALGQALRIGRYESLWFDGVLDRADQPQGFWVAVGLNGVFAAIAFGLVIEAVIGLF